MRTSALLVLFLAIGVASGAEEAASPQAVTWTTERVVVFKDGFCLVTRLGKAVSDEKGRVYTEEVPDSAVLGSVWAVPVSGRLLSMHAGIETRETTTTSKVPVANFAGALRANQGRHCEVRLGTGETLAGPIVAVLATTFLLGDRMLPIAQVQRLEIEEMVYETERTVTTKKTAKRLTFTFEGGAAPREVRLMYFRPGVRWIPTYRLALPEDDGDDKAELSLQAEILNEAEDLVDVPFDLVVGVPNFRFREVVSPMVLEREMRRAAASTSPFSGAGTNAIHTQVSNVYHGPSPSRPGSTTPGDVRLPEEISAGGTQDLFVYHLPKMTLKKGHRAAVPIFTAKAPLAHVYTFEHHVAKGADRSSNRRRDASPLKLATTRIWHQLSLGNETRVPWTTGPVMILRGSQPLAQELLTYTPSGGSTRVPLTAAVDLRAAYAERETKREQSVLRWAGDTYARIDMQGTVTLTSYKTVPVTVEVVVSMGGRAEEVSNDGEVTISPFSAPDWRSYRGDPEVNNHSDVRWRITLEPGATEKLTVGYHFFVEH